MQRGILRKLAGKLGLAEEGLASMLETTLTDLCRVANKNHDLIPENPLAQKIKSGRRQKELVDNPKLAAVASELGVDLRMLYRFDGGGKISGLNAFKCALGLRVPLNSLIDIAEGGKKPLLRTVCDTGYVRLLATRRLHLRAAEFPPLVGNDQLENNLLGQIMAAFSSENIKVLPQIDTEELASKNFSMQFGGDVLLAVEKCEAVFAKFQIVARLTKFPIVAMSRKGANRYLFEKIISGEVPGRIAVFRGSFEESYIRTCGFDPAEIERFPFPETQALASAVGRGTVEIALAPKSMMEEVAYKFPENMIFESPVAFAFYCAWVRKGENQLRFALQGLWQNYQSTNQMKLRELNSKLNSNFTFLQSYFDLESFAAFLK
jgi:hypothetical protein